MKGQMRIDTYNGSGAAQNIELGFVPDFVLIVNETDGNLVGLWFKGMAAGTAIDIAAAVTANAADGITAYEGTTGGNAKGFSVGTDFSTNAKVYRYVAFANQ